MPNTCVRQPPTTHPIMGLSLRLFCEAQTHTLDDSAAIRTTTRGSRQRRSLMWLLRLPPAAVRVPASLSPLLQVCLKFEAAQASRPVLCGWPRTTRLDVGHARSEARRYLSLRFRCCGESQGISGTSALRPLGFGDSTLYSSMVSF